jgi:hypothetical protein
MRICTLERHLSFHVSLEPKLGESTGARERGVALATVSGAGLICSREPWTRASRTLNPLITTGKRGSRLGTVQRLFRRWD